MKLAVQKQTWPSKIFVVIFSIIALSGCGGQRQVTVVTTKNVTPASSKPIKQTRTEKAQLKTKADLQTDMQSFSKERELLYELEGQTKSQDQEAKFEKLLKKEIMKKYETAKANCAWWHDYNPIQSHSEILLKRQFHFPYSWYQSILDGMIYKFERSLRSAQDDDLRSKVDQFLTQLNTLKRTVKESFSDQLMNEQRDLTNYYATIRY